MTKQENHILEVTVLPGVDTLVIKKADGDLFFKTTPSSILISKQAFITLINFFVKNDVINYRVLEGILEEYNSSKF